MSIQIGAKPDSGFDDPLGMLTDCHRRIERFLHILCAVPDRAMGRALTDEESTAVQAALKYFREGGQRHTADEEESLFPRLKANHGAAALEELEHLEHDHQVAAELHAEVETLYSNWISAGRLDEIDAEQLAASTQRLNDLYAAHIKVEEGIVFPSATQLLDSATIQQIGQEFRDRRA